jgi:hypothetical protein
MAAHDGAHLPGCLAQRVWIQVMDESFRIVEVSKEKKSAIFGGRLAILLERLGKKASKINGQKNKCLNSGMGPTYSEPSCGIGFLNRSSVVISGLESEFLHDSMTRTARANLKGADKRGIGFPAFCPFCADGERLQVGSQG